MSSITERILKNGSRVYDIRVNRGRDLITGKQLTPFYERYVPSGTWSRKKAMMQAQIEAARFEVECENGLIPTKEDKIQKREHLKEAEKARRLEESRKPTFKQYCDLLLKEMQISNAAGTIENYHYVLKRAGPVFDSYKMEDITPVMIKEYLLDFQANRKNAFNGKPVSYKTVLREYTVLHRIFQSAVENEVIQTSPMMNIKRPKPRKDELNKEAQVYTEEEIKYIIKCLDNEPLKWKAMILFMIDSGCRRGEAAGLMWDAVNLETGEVNICRNAQYTSGKGTYITTPKSGKNRTIYLNSPVLAVMKEWKMEQTRFFLAQGYPNEGYCFTRDNGKVLNPQAPTAYLSSFGKKYGIKNLHPHALRHTMATLSIANGADIVSISKKLGHSETAITLNIYSHVNKQAQMRANKVLGDAIYFPRQA